MLDSYKREISYLRISVSDRCNLACTYCMPAEQAGRTRRQDILSRQDMLNRQEILSRQEIADVVSTLVPLGIQKVRLTGGEPLLRPDIEELVEMLAAIEGIRDLSMTTNAQLLAARAHSLAEKGLKRVNISLDSLDASHYREITRGGDLRKVLQGIDAALDAGLHPVKINCVLTPDTGQSESDRLKEFCREKGLELRFIRQMDLSRGKFWRVEGGQGGQCARCNRMRLTVDGRFIPCLFGEQEFDIREYGIRGAFEKAIRNKPERGWANRRHNFYQIGG